jgi:prepilin-type N-terminal cleavage/methylation domain-containing protein
MLAQSSMRHHECKAGRRGRFSAASLYVKHLMSTGNKEDRVKDLSRGFSLIELLIVVAIILIISTIAVPSLLRSRQSAQESSAVALLRTINTAEVTYISSNQGTYGDIPSMISQGILDPRFAGSVSGYNFAVNYSGSDYTASATPISASAGRFGYYSTPDVVIRYQTATTATCTPCYPGTLSGSPVQ